MNRVTRRWQATDGPQRGDPRRTVAGGHPCRPSANGLRSSSPRKSPSGRAPGREKLKVRSYLSHPLGKGGLDRPTAHLLAIASDAFSWLPPLRRAGLGRRAATSVGQLPCWEGGGRGGIARTAHSWRKTGSRRAKLAITLEPAGPVLPGRAVGLLGAVAVFVMLFERRAFDSRDHGAEDRGPRAL